MFGLIRRTARHVSYGKVYRRLKNFTMIAPRRYALNLRLVDLYRRLPGTVVECGTWKGGMIAGMATRLGTERDYYLFDSFEGLPPPKDIDGEGARRWRTEKDASRYHDNCRADEDDAREAMRLAGCSDYHLAKGWFEETLPSYHGGPIAILRLDADWYESTMLCLEHLFPQITVGGILIVDDYYTWDGCARALHDYLSREKRRERIRQLDNSLCYLRKEKESST